MGTILGRWRPQGYATTMTRAGGAKRRTIVIIVVAYPCGRQVPLQPRCIHHVIMHFRGSAPLPGTFATSLHPPRHHALSRWRTLARYLCNSPVA
ncbi:MAG TPA: hypothetical protein VNG51_04305 [Ktedonobacteraceae bacterium]|nr:hypothetical protein [Ktedonobacteraceae bacterium]